MSALPHDDEQVRVEADGAELEAPRNQAVTAVLEEGEQVTRAWTARQASRRAVRPSSTSRAKLTIGSG